MAGIILNVVTDPQFGESAAGGLMLNIAASASEFQQELTRERMAEPRSALKQKGRRVAGRVPYCDATDPGTQQLVIPRRAANRIRKERLGFAKSGGISTSGIRSNGLEKLSETWCSTRTRRLWR